MKLTKNFKLSEFRSRDGAVTPHSVRPSLKKLAQNLEVIRSALGDKPITINSGYRSKAHNYKVGSNDSSQHRLGKAADIKVEGVRPSTVADTIERLIAEGKISQGGLGRYAKFTHYDIRGTRARW